MIRSGIKKYRTLLIILGVLLAFFISPPAVLMEIQIDFVKEDYTAGNHWKVLTSYQEHVGLDSVERTYEEPGIARVVFLDASFRQGTYVKRMDPIDYNSENEIEIQSITFFVNGFYAGKLEGIELRSSFVPNEQVEMYETEEGNLGFRIQGEDSQLITTESFAKFYSETAKQYARTGILYFIPLLAAVAFVLVFYRKYVLKVSDSRLFIAVNTLLYVVGVCAVALIVFGAFAGLSSINPDESEGIYSVQYYTTHWKIPDMRDLELEAFSKYGTARLFELNLYYILAAQIARFITFENGARFFGVLLGAFLFFFLFANLKKNRYLLCALFLTPQVWYLYTYCTSDALDFAVAVLVLYQIANPESTLQRLVGAKIGKRDVWKVLALGFLFSNIFMSKQNYYVIAVYAFTMLLTELFAEEKEQRKRRFVNYLWIAGAAFLCLGIRYIPEFLHYGIHKQQVILKLQNEIAIPKLRPNSPPEVQSSTFFMFNKGISFKEFWLNMGLNKMLFRSFTGTYGCLAYPSPKWYFKVMGVLYILFYLGISWNIWREKGAKDRKIKFLLLHLSALISYLLVLYNGYFIDFQAQGRYMLPVLIFVAHAAALHPDTVRQKWFQILISVTAVLSLYSFAFYCIPNIQPV